MDNEIKAVLFELAASHAKLASAEYNRNMGYNSSHFSHKAEEHFIALMNKHNLMDEFLAYCKECDRRG